MVRIRDSGIFLALILSGIKKSVDEQRNLMASSKLLSVYASSQHTRIGIPYLQTFTSA